MWVDQWPASASMAKLPSYDEVWANLQKNKAQRSILPKGAQDETMKLMKILHQTDKEYDGKLRRGDDNSSHSVCSLFEGSSEPEEPANTGEEREKSVKIPTKKFSRSMQIRSLSR